MLEELNIVLETCQGLLMASILEAIRTVSTEFLSNCRYLGTVSK